MLSAANLDGVAYFVIYLFGGIISFILFFILGIWLVIDKKRKVKNERATDIKIISMLSFLLITFFFLAKILNIGP